MSANCVALWDLGVLLRVSAVRAENFFNFIPMASHQGSGSLSQHNLVDPKCTLHCVSCPQFLPERCCLGCLAFLRGAGTCNPHGKVLARCWCQSFALLKGMCRYPFLKGDGTGVWPLVAVARRDVRFCKGWGGGMRQRSAAIFAGPW